MLCPWEGVLRGLEDTAVVLDASCCSVLLSSGGTRGAALLQGVLCGPGRRPQGNEERGRWLCGSITPSRGDEGLCRPAVNSGALSCWMLSVQILGAVAVPEVRARFCLVGRRPLLALPPHCSSASPSDIRESTWERARREAGRYGFRCLHGSPRCSLLVSASPRVCVAGGV